MTVKKICCLGLGQAGVPLSAVIAIKCPEIRVTVVHTNPEHIFQWNAKQIPGSVYAPGLDDLIRKCQNRNLFFTTNDEASIKEADIIFIISESKIKTFGEGEGQALDMSMVEEAAHLITDHSESDKIVVENSAVPMKTAECVKKILKHNSRPGVRFQVLSNPEFYEEGSAIQNLLFPDRVLIGCDDTPEGQAAARELAFIYERWVSPQNVITKGKWTVELSKISSSMFIAQKMTNIYALSAICEESGSDVIEVTRLMGNDYKLSFGLLDSCLGESRLFKSVSSLLYMCESLGLVEVADYWQQVFQMNKFHRDRFMNRLIWALSQTASERRIAVLGFAYYKDTTVTKGSASIDLCKYLLEERATLSIYDPKVTQNQIVEDLKAAGCYVDTENIKRVLTAHDDPYRAVFQSQVIVISTIWPEFLHLDFRRIFAEMIKPAYLFDSGNFLPHQELVRIGFKVYTIGKFIKNS